MKKALIIILVMFLASCNIAQFAQTIMLKDSNGNKYSLTTKYANDEHKVGVSICYENKCYTCEAIYDPNFSVEAMAYEIDLDILNKTGMGMITYKGQKYSCKVE